jgi:hypothetical protein
MKVIFNETLQANLPLNRLPSFYESAKNFLGVKSYREITVIDLENGTSVAYRNLPILFATNRPNSWFYDLYKIRTVGTILILNEEESSLLIQLVQNEAATEKAQKESYAHPTFSFDESEDEDDDDDWEEDEDEDFDDDELDEDEEELDDESEDDDTKENEYDYAGEGWGVLDNHKATVSTILNPVHVSDTTSKSLLKALHSLDLDTSCAIELSGAIDEIKELFSLLELTQEEHDYLKPRISALVRAYFREHYNKEEDNKYSKRKIYEI